MLYLMHMVVSLVNKVNLEKWFHWQTLIAPNSSMQVYLDGLRIWIKYWGMLVDGNLYKLNYLPLLSTSYTNVIKSIIPILYAVSPLFFCLGESWWGVPSLDGFVHVYWLVCIAAYLKLETENSPKKGSLVETEFTWAQFWYSWKKLWILMYVLII